MTLHLTIILPLCKVEQLQHTSFLKAFGNNLRRVRKLKGFSQEKLAYESEIELRQIGRIERVEINTGIYSAAIIAETLKVSIIDLFDFKY